MSLWPRSTLLHPAPSTSGAFDLYNRVPSKEATQPIGFQGANRQSMRRVLSDVVGAKGLNSDMFYYTTPTNWGHLDAPDRTIEANNRATMADTGHRLMSRKENTGVVITRLRSSSQGSPDHFSLVFKNPNFPVRLTSAPANKDALIIKNTCY